MKVSYLIATMAGAIAMSASASALTVVKTEGGGVSGIGDSVESFRGVPYAAAPEGLLR